MASRFVLPFADVGEGIIPSNGAELFFFETGTSTPKDTYSDAAGTTPNANPVLADSDGVFPDIFISGTYKVQLKDTNGVQKWEADPVDEFTKQSTVEGAIKNFSTLALAKASLGLTTGDQFTITGRPDPYTVVASTTRTLDDGAAFAISAGGFAEAQFSEFVNVLQYDLDNTGATDDTVKMQAAVDFGSPVYIPKGSFQFANILPSTTGGEMVVFGAGSGQTTVNPPNGFSGYLFNTTGRYDIRGIASVGDSADGVDGQYFLGSDGAGEASGRPTLKDLRLFNYEQGIRFGTEYEHPLGLYYELVYVQNFSVAGINLGGTTGVASSGESAWQFDDCIVTNPSNTPTEYAVVVTPNTPSTSEDSLDWSAVGDSPEFGYIVLRSADGSTDWHVPPNWTSANFTSTTYVADKTISETWNYKVLRMTVGIACRRAKCVNFGAVQTEYTGIGIRLDDVQAVSIGSSYFEIRNSTGARGGFAAIYCASVNAGTIDSMWAEEAGYGVFVAGNSKVVVKGIRASALSWAAIGNTGSTDQVIGYENIEGATTIYRSPAGNAQDFNYLGREYTSSEHLTKLSHTTKVGHELQHRGVKKGGVFADSTGAWAELDALDLILSSKTLRPVVTNAIGTTALTDGVATDCITFDTVSSNSDGSARFHYKVEVFSGGVDRQTESGWLDINTLNVATATPTVSVQESNTLQTINSGTLTVAFSATPASGSATIECNANTSLGTPSINLEITPISVMGNISNLVQL